ncbi:MAG: hypothetical protein Q8O91_01010 [Candidatus Aminicenantes bacterium]|nr:hypothetical protein [Candidatus Aminicenantes bacterium]
MSNKRLWFSGLLILAAILVPAGAAGLSQTKSAQKAASAVKAEEFDYAAVLKTFRLRNIGPANMGGRTVDFAVPDRNTSIIYAAVGPSGLWKSSNAGITWEPSFVNEGSVSVGAVAVAQSAPDIVWVGSGEATARNSVAIGDGVYKSEDAGRTWKNMGLAETRFIARICVDPTNPDVVFAASQGHLWGPNEERGVYRTADGGKSWKKVLYIDKDTGCSDLDMDPSNPKILYAGMWKYRRSPYYFYSGGETSGLFKTTDGGETWMKLAGGLPGGIIGRIGVGLCRSKPNVVYTLIEHATEAGLYRTDNKGETWVKMGDKRTYDRTNFRPFYYSRLTADPNNEFVVYVYSGSSYVSRDGGRTYDTIGRGTHSDHHALWIDPFNSSHIIDGNDGGIDISWDGGRTYHTVQSKAWAEIYNVAYDMRDPYWVNIGLQDNGNWEGPSNSRDRSGILNQYWSATGGGDGFYAQIDPTDWTILYRNLQMGGIERHDLRTFLSQAIKPQAPLGEEPYRFNWNSPIYLSPHDHSVLYFGGNYVFRSRDKGRSWEKAGPDLSTNDPKKKIDSGGPITIDNTGAEIHCTILSISESPLKKGTIWVGTDDGQVQVTRDDGKTWTNVTKAIKGLGPDDNWVTRVEASHFAEGAAFISISRHQVDDYKPYIFKTGDYGATWVSLASSLPAVGYIHVVREDLENPNLLFAGSEFGLFFSFDGGKKWIPYKTDFPTIAVRDIQIHPRERDLIVGTHGRGVWIMDDIRPLEKLSAETVKAEGALFDVRNATIHGMKSTSDIDTNDFAGVNPVFGALINYYLNPAAAKEAKLKLTIRDKAGKDIRTLQAPPAAGVNRVVWDLRPETAAGAAAGGQRGMSGDQRGTGSAQAGTSTIGTTFAFGGGQRGMGGGGGFGGGTGGGYVDAGEYQAVLDVNGKTFEKTFTVKDEIGIPADEKRLNQKVALDAAPVISAASRLMTQVEQLATQLQQLETNLAAVRGVDPAVTAKLKTVKDKLGEIQKVYFRTPEGQTQYRQLYFNALRGGTMADVAMRGGRAGAYPGAPTQMAIDKIEEVKAFLAPLQKKMAELLETDVPALNKLLAEKGIPFINIR